MIMPIGPGTPLELPVVLQKLCAGFPSPADDHLDESIDLTKLLVARPAATYLWRVEGHSMRGAGIYDGDLLVVDRSLTPKDGDVVVATVLGERSLKRLRYRAGRPRLEFDNEAMPPFEAPEDVEIEIWGVVVANIHWHRAGG